MSEPLYPFRANYEIELIGCDDHTKIEFFLDGHEVPLLMEIAEKINEVGGGCSPTMHVTEIK